MDYEDNIELEVTRNKSLLPGPRSAEYHVLEDIVGMIEFNMMRSSPTAKPASVTFDQEFLMSAAN